MEGRIWGFRKADKGSRKQIVRCLDMNEKEEKGEEEDQEEEDQEEEKGQGAAGNRLRI